MHPLVRSPLLLGAALSGCASTEPPSSPAPYPWHLVGEDGRVVVHRGVNLNSTAKRSGYDHGVHDELPLLGEHGVTLVRLLTFWQAIEPEQGAYDDAYLAGLRTTLDALHAQDIAVVLDLHQDVYGQGFGFTGFPSWTCDASNYDTFSRPEGAWFLAYAQPEVVACFDDFWGSEPLQHAYGAMAAQLVAELGDHPAVIGLDVINEPYWGSANAGVHDEQILPTFYGRVLEAVRAVDPHLRLFLAPSVASNLTTEPLLDLSALDDPYLAVSPHFYPTYSELGTGYDGDFTEEAGALGRLADHAQDQGVPLFLGEFGIFSALGGEDDYVRAVLRTVGDRGGSAAYWAFDKGSNLLTPEGEAGSLLPVLGEPWLYRLPGRVEGIDGLTARLTLNGPGNLDVMAPAGQVCDATATGALVVGVERLGRTILVSLEGEGEVAVTVSCTP